VEDLQKLLGQLMIMINLVGHPSDQIVHDINSERGKEGLPALYQNKKLQDSATKKANDMVTNKYFSHTNTEGQLPWNLIKQSGYNYTKAGENLGRGYPNDADLIQAWMDSLKHKENILNPNYTDIGTGTADQYTVQHFGATKEPTVLDYLLGRMK
jgi:uncharacterized protein YkwD